MLEVILFNVGYKQGSLLNDQAAKYYLRCNIKKDDFFGRLY